MLNVRGLLEMSVEKMSCVRKLREFGLMKESKIVKTVKAYNREDARKIWELSRRQAQNWITEEAYGEAELTCV
jgi:hypothetical protein